MPTTRISSKGQLVLPAEMRSRDGIRAGHVFDVERLDRGEYLLKRRQGPSSEGLVDWLESCPEKGFFTSPPSESTDSLDSPWSEPA